MRRPLCLGLAAIFFFQLPLWAGLGSHTAMYVGGTATQVKERTEGKLSFESGMALTFEGGGSKLSIPYPQINSLEYGQKAGRRLGLSMAVSPLFLLSKKRKHFLTVGYLDSEKKQQAAVFELGKDIIQSTITTLESKTGKKVEFEDDEARKSARDK